MNGVNHCEICGERLAGSQEGYRAHLKRFHSANPHASINPVKSPITPLRTSARSKAQIVHDMEKTWGYSIIPDVKPWHSLEVR